MDGGMNKRLDFLIEFALKGYNRTGIYNFNQGKCWASRSFLVLTRYRLNYAFKASAVIVIFKISVFDYLLLDFNCLLINTMKILRKMVHLTVNFYGILRKTFWGILLLYASLVSGGKYQPWARSGQRWTQFLPVIKDVIINNRMALEHLKKL